MSLDRREFLKMAGASLGGVIVQPSAKMFASSGGGEDGMGMLYDAPNCIGCKKCQEACREERVAQDPETLESELVEDPKELSAGTWTLIKLYQDKEDPTIFSFVKTQCMHCEDPACVAVCPVGALEKTEDGPVIYHKDICIGCRYCMAACPFEIPKYQWEKVLPLVRKCDFCADRQKEGLEPACSAACQNDVLQFGKRSELLAMAHERIANEPEKYIDHVYGEHEAGGTAKLYLSHVPFDKLGLPELDSEPLPERTLPWMKAVPGVIVGVGTLMGAIFWATKRRIENQKEK